jgi:hypothetical protein
MSVDIDAFMSSLASNSNKREKLIEKFNLGFTNEKGNYFYILFPSKGGQWITNLGKVREFKGFSTKRGKDAWFEILNKKDYGNLSEDEEKLYDEVLRLYSQVESMDANIDQSKWQLKHTRSKTYCITFAHVIKFINHDTGVVDKDKVNKPALLIFPSGRYSDSFSTACQTKTSIMGNNKWMLKILTNDPKNREAIVTTDFFGGQGGYNCSVGFEMDKDAVKSMLPENYDFTNERDTFADTNIIREFLGWQAPEESEAIFNMEIFKEIRLRMLDLIHPAKETPVSVQQATQPQSVTTPTPSAVSSVEQSGSDDDLPF